jgi:hypothetical protein
VSEDDASNSGVVMQKVDRVVKRIPVLNMNSDPALSRSEFITARASTAERMIVEKLQLTLGLANQSQLVRNLIEEKVQELGGVL